MRSLPILDASGCYQGNLEGFKNVPPKESVFFQMSGFFWESSPKSVAWGVVSQAVISKQLHIFCKSNTCLPPSSFRPSLHSFLESSLSGWDVPIII